MLLSLCGLAQVRYGLSQCGVKGDRREEEDVGDKRASKKARNRGKVEEERMAVVFRKTKFKALKPP